MWTLCIMALVILAVACCNTSHKADEAAEAEFQTVSPGYVPVTPEPMDEDTLHPEMTEDILLLAKIMQQETRKGWPDWAVMCVGEVVCNRVDSPLFPNTVHDVIYQTDPVQYAPVWADGWEELVPDAEYIDLAMRLMDGERAMHDSGVVWQALFPQGERTVVTYYDSVLNNTTYFCK